MLSAELALEDAVDLSQDRKQNDRDVPQCSNFPFHKPHMHRVPILCVNSFF
jgi:hypothetical protein